MTKEKTKAFTIWTRAHAESWKDYVPEEHWELEQHVQEHCRPIDITPIYKVLRLKAQKVLAKHGVMTPPSSSYRARMLLRKLKLRLAPESTTAQIAKVRHDLYDDARILEDYIKVWDTGMLVSMETYKTDIASKFTPGVTLAPS